MNQGIKYLYLIFGILIIIGLGFIISNKPEPIDCNSFSVIFLKASELQYASKIADERNVVVSIPELNQIIARTEILDCPNFDYTKYIYLGK